MRCWHRRRAGRRRRKNACGVGRVDAARGVGQAFFGDDDGPLGEAAVHGVDVVLGLWLKPRISDPTEVPSGWPELEAASVRPRGVEPADDGLHLAREARAELVVLDGPLFIAHGPEDDRRVVAVAPHQALQLVAQLGRGAHDAVLADDEHAEAVAGVQQLGRGGGDGPSGWR